MFTVRRRPLLLAVVIVVLSAICIAEGVSMKRNSIQALFIGNSYTFVNVMPSTLEQLSALAHDARPIRCTMAAEGSATLESHWNSPKTRAILRSRKWDVVVLQEQSTRPITDFQMFDRYGGLLADEVRASGAKVFYFMTWARKDSPQTQGIITGAYRGVALQHGGVVVPVGEAWRVVRERKPDIELFADDGSHPSPTGSYLTACVFYAAFTGKSPVRLPAVAGLSPQDARFLQKAARDAVKQE
jgi:hypothetical protein